MKCPHCLINFHDAFQIHELGVDVNDRWYLLQRRCPECKKFIFSFSKTEPKNNYEKPTHEIFVIPKTISRSAIPAEVPSDFTTDYYEACMILSDSPKASAALSRRCLQYLLREMAKVKPSNLFEEIQEVVDRKELSSNLSEQLNTVRIIGNFATHPIKSESTGEIIDVEPGEAEWNLDVLEALYDHYFVQPNILRKRKEALNEKLKESGKKELK